MTLTERQNYGIAITVSIILHALLLLIYFPVGVLNGDTDLDTYSTGLVNLGVQPQDVSVVKAEPLQAETLPQPTRSSVISKESSPKAKPEPVVKQTERVTGESISKPSESTPQPGSVLKNTPDHGAAKNLEAGAPAVPQVKSLGDGSGMFSKKGTLKKPVYPKDAVTAGIEGDVKLRVLIFANGSIETIEILQTSGDLRLDNSAKNYIVKDWHFNPNSEPYYVDVLMMFRIKTPFNYHLLGSQTRL